MTVGKEKPEGVILSQGGFFGGWSAWLDQGVPVYSYNYLGIETYTVRGNQPLAEGKNEIVFDFAYDGDVGKGGTMTISVGGESIGKGRIEKTQPFLLSTETTGVGFDTETPVVPEYGAAPDNEFRGGTLGTIRVSRPE